MISVASNEIPREMSALVRAALDGEWEQARRLQRKYLPLMEMNFWESSPGPVKCALALMRECGETLRLPLAPMRDDTRRKIAPAPQGSHAAVMLSERIEAIASRQDTHSGCWRKCFGRRVPHGRRVDSYAGNSAMRRK